MITELRINVYLIIALNRLRRSGSVPRSAIIIGITAYSWAFPWDVALSRGGVRAFKCSNEIYICLSKNIRDKDFIQAQYGEVTIGMMLNYCCNNMVYTRLFEILGGTAGH
jgi:hypothetical protein